MESSRTNKESFLKVNLSMIENYLGVSGHTYKISAANSDGQLYDFSKRVFLDKPSTTFREMKVGSYPNIFVVDTTDIIGAADRSFIFIHENDNTLPKDTIEYVNLKIDFLKGAQGPPGKDGDKGDRGDRGPRGEVVVTVVSDSDENPNNNGKIK